MLHIGTCKTTQASIFQSAGPQGSLCARHRPGLPRGLLPRGAAALRRLGAGARLAARGAGTSLCLRRRSLDLAHVDVWPLNCLKEP